MALQPPLKAGAQPTCRFWDLSPELRCMIYRFAYGEDRIIKVVSRNEWSERELSRRRSSGPVFIRPFPESPLSHMLVSKQFFVEAAHDSVAHQTFSFSNSFIKSVSSIRLSVGSLQYLSALKDLQSLRDVVVELYPGGLEAEGWKRAEYYDFSDLDLVRIPGISDLLSLRGLRRFSVVLRRDQQFDNPEKAARWNRNAARLTSLLTSVTSQPRKFKQSDQRETSEENEIRAQTSFNPTLFKRTHIDPAPDKALSIYEIPATETEFAKLLFSRPKALFALLQNFKVRIGKLDRLRDSMHPIRPQ